jgi:DNA-binding transcriptional LysR family regulator
MKIIRPFDTRQLEAFDMLCQTGSFTKTAKNLFLTQSAVSHSMKNLEEEAGCKLLRRQGKKVALTEAGDRLLNFVRPFLDEMENLRQELDGFEKFGGGRIRLGASAQACRFLLPPLLKKFEKVHENCRFEVKCEDTPACMDALEDGSLDLAITLCPYNSSEIEFVPCFRDELRVVVPPSHDWAKAGKVDWESAYRESFILYNRNSYTFRILTDYLDRLGLRLSSFMEISSPDASKELIKVGMGVGILADWAIEEDSKKGDLISLPLGSKKLTRTWGVSVRKGRRLNKAERLFINIAEESGSHWMVNRTL